MRQYPATIFVPQDQRQDWRWPLATLLLFAIILSLNPVGYRGGGADDWQYLQAARCWVENGPCLPRDHWWGRWPLVAPTAALLSLFGESRAVLGLVPLAATLGCGLLVAHLGNRLFGRPSGWVAAMLFLSAPVVLFEALDPTIDGIELLLLLGSAALLMKASDDQRSRTFLVAGLLFGLAFQARETSVAALPAAGLFLLAKAKRRFRALLAFGLGAFAPFAVELLIYGAATGDPLFRRHLSVAHTSLPSSELAAATPAGTLPFFRWSLIAGWHHETGIDLHWLVDGPADTLINAKSGWTLLATLVALALFGRLLRPDQRRRAGLLLALGTAHALLLIFALSIDPKPRMMLAPLAAAAMVAGALLLKAPRWVVPPLVAARLAALSMVFLIEPRMAPGEDAARRWLAELPTGAVETTESTRRRLALVPAAEVLPLADGSRPYLLVRTSRPCNAARLHNLAPARTLVTEREQRLGWINPVSGRYKALCLFRYGDGDRAKALAAAHDTATPFTDDAPHKDVAHPPPG